MNDRLDPTLATDVDGAFAAAISASLHADADRGPRMPESWAEAGDVRVTSTGEHRRAPVIWLSTAATAAVAAVAAVAAGVVAVAIGGADSTLVPGGSGGTSSATSVAVSVSATFDRPPDTAEVVPADIDRQSLVGDAALDPLELVPDQSELLVLEAQAINALIGDCMARQGFRYVGPPVGAATAVDFAFRGRASREQFGYGIEPSPMGWASDDAKAEYTRQFEDPAFLVALRGDDPDAQMGGCALEANTAVYPPDGVAVPARNREWNDAVGAFYESVIPAGDGAGDAELVAAAAVWRGCMDGVAAEDILRFEDLAYETILDESMSPRDMEQRASRLRFDRGEDLGSPASVDEIRLAMIDFDCQVSTDFATRWYPRLAALVASFRDVHIDLVTEQVDFANAVADRCRAILATR